MTTTYHQYLQQRRQLNNTGGITPTHIPDHLFDFQKHLVEWSVRQGRAAIFADCGMGKTLMLLAWAQNIHTHTGKPILVLSPLAVGHQIVTEAHKFGYDAALSRDGSAPAPITVTNYEQLEKFDPARFGGVVCDESSILKNFDGVTKSQITEFMRLIQYRLLDTATAAPNDYTELGTSSEALGDMGYVDMVSRFFTNKRRTGAHGGGWTQRTGDEYRLKGPAKIPFWKWVSTWARAIRKPSDYGFDDGPFILPKLVEQTHEIEARTAAPGALFDVPAIGFREEREERRRTITERCEAAANLLYHPGHSVAWCQLNDESQLLTQLIDGAVELTGSDPLEAKEEKLLAFSDGEIKTLVTKPIIGAWGLNWQHANHMTYFPSHSYEQYYQSVRRMWRFGQTQPVTVDAITTPGGRSVLANLRKKAGQADQMFDALVTHMNDAQNIPTTNYTKEIEVPKWVS